ncbi:hypothetical protein MY11210_006281 [Beauveria gryllotalpidicola]
MDSFVVEAWISDVAMADAQPDTPRSSKTRGLDAVGVVIPKRARQQASLFCAGLGCGAMLPKHLTHHAFPEGRKSARPRGAHPVHQEAERWRSMTPDHFSRRWPLIAAGESLAAGGPAVAPRLSKRLADPTAHMVRRDRAGERRSRRIPCGTPVGTISSTTPLLEHATLHIPHLEVELIITSAQIMPALPPPAGFGRAGPRCRHQKLAPLAAAYRSTESIYLPRQHAVSPPSQRRGASLGRSSRSTRRATSRCVRSLRRVFIVTKTTSGTQDSANVQLGIWVAAWYERMRTVAEQAGIEERLLLTLPVIQVVGGVWSVLLIVDGGTHIHVLDDDCRIGNTNNIVGIYQLQASIAALGRWVEETFTPWFTDLLTRAVENRA